MDDRSADRAAPLIARQTVVDPLAVRPICANGSIALNRWSRLNSNRLPENRLVPDFVTALTDAPECMPFCAVRPLVATRNSCSASGNGQRQVRVVLRIVVHGAVEQVRDAERQSARDRDVHAAGEAAAVRAARVHGRAGQHEQARHLASLQRQLHDPLALDDLADAGALHVDERRCGFDRDRLLRGRRVRATTLMVGVAATCSTMPVCT